MLHLVIKYIFSYLCLLYTTFLHVIFGKPVKLYYIIIFVCHILILNNLVSPEYILPSILKKKLMYDDKNNIYKNK